MKNKLYCPKSKGKVMSKLYCPKCKGEMRKQHYDYAEPAMYCNKCVRPYFLIDCLTADRLREQDEEQLNEAEIARHVHLDVNGNEITPHGYIQSPSFCFAENYVSDKDAIEWINFSDRKPEVGQKVNARCTNGKVNPLNTYTGIVKKINLKKVAGLTIKYGHGELSGLNQWKPVTEHIVKPNKPDIPLEPYCEAHQSFDCNPHIHIDEFGRSIISNGCVMTQRRRGKSESQIAIEKVIWAFESIDYEKNDDEFLRVECFENFLTIIIKKLKELNKNVK